MRHALILLALLSFVGCKSQMYGTGKAYLFNGTENRVTVKMDGRTPIDVLLRSNMGKVIEDVIADDYQVSITKEDGFPWLGSIEVVKERLTVINADGAGCFARADVSGMYNEKKAPVRLLELYRGQQVISIADEIDILPGEGMPEKRPKTVYAFQRFMPFPCDLEDDWMVEDFVQKRR